MGDPVPEVRRSGAFAIGFLQLAPYHIYLMSFAE